MTLTEAQLSGIERDARENRPLVTEDIPMVEEIRATLAERDILLAVMDETRVRIDDLITSTYALARKGGETLICAHCFSDVSGSESSDGLSDECPLWTAWFNAVRASKPIGEEWCKRARSPEWSESSAT